MNKYINKVNSKDIDTTRKMRFKIDYVLEKLNISFLKFTNKKLYEISSKLIKLIKSNKSKNDLYNFIHDCVNELNDNDIILITRFLVFYEMLTNVVEDIYLIPKTKIWDSQKIDKNDDLYKILKNFTKKSEIDCSIKNFNINIVLTAHPTQVQRETTLRLLREIMITIDKTRYKNELLEISNLCVDDNIQSLIDSLWQVAILRDEKIKVNTEIKSILNYFDTTFFDIIPKINQKYESYCNYFLKKTTREFNPIFTINSWIGGDRDGNPFVDGDSLENALEMQVYKVFSYYNDVLKKSYSDLLLHKSLTVFSDELNEFVSDINLDNRKNENYAKAIIKIVSKLRNTYNDFQIKDYHISWFKEYKIKEKYSNHKEFFSDLMLIYNSLHKNSLHLLIQRNFIDILYAVNTFGFWLLSIDVRQNSKNHENLICDLFIKNNICSSYSGLSEIEKINLLEEMMQKHINFNFSYLSNESKKEIDIFNKINFLKNKFGNESIKNYLISNSQSVSDFLEVVFLLKITNNLNRDLFLNIVPLFETINDLNNSKNIVNSLIENKHISKLIKNIWNNSLEILLGYSDSCKDGGYLTSSWKIYNVQEELTLLAKNKNINITFFHGRGGTIGRGGGPSYMAIKAQPPHSIKNKIRFTEQGEIIWAKYSNPHNGWFNLINILNATIWKICESSAKNNRSSLYSALNKISDLSVFEYKKLVFKNKEFEKIFFEITPIKEISRLKIGSRPSSRNNKNSIKDLRAIPWIFSWSQIRLMLPGWYGLGSALTKYGNIDELKKFYKTDSFFNSLISNVEMLISKINIDIAKKYFLLSQNSNSNFIYKKIINEYLILKTIILKIMDKKEILENSDYLKLSLKYRLPYIDALNIFQIELMKLRNDNKNINETKEALLMTINGIATGLRNSG